MLLPCIQTTTMSNISDIKNWDDERLMEDLNNDNNNSAAKFTKWRQRAKEKKVVEERRKAEAEVEARRKVEEEAKKKAEEEARHKAKEEAEVQRKATEQERLQVAQEAYLAVKEAWKHKVAEEKAADDGRWRKSKWSRVEQWGRGRRRRRPWSRALVSTVRGEGLSVCPQLRVRQPPVQRVNWQG